MRAIACAALCSCLFTLALPAAPAQAGGYGYGVHGWHGGYGGYGARHVWYSSSCCYRKVVRHQRDVVYFRAGTDIPDYVVVYPQPPVYAQYAAPYRRVRSSEFDYYSRWGDYGRVGCYWNETPIHDWVGWVWGVRTRCY